MDKIQKADIVMAVAGRDLGGLFLVLSEQDEYLFIADGKRRRIETPKRKKRKHVKLEARHHNRVTAKLFAGEKVTNSELRNALGEYLKHREREQAEQKGGKAYV